MPHNLHDGFGINSRIREIGDGTVPKVMKDEVFNLLLLTQPLNLTVGVVEFLPILVENQPLNAHNAILSA
jgi:hypothetical protein